MQIRNILENVKNISTDSRDIAPGDLFIAIKGDNFDGHDFVLDVIERGAIAAVVSQQIDGIPADKQIVVSDTRDAYLQIGNHIRKKINPRVVALTGSAGKTTTKEILKFILSKFANAHATVGNNNNNIGVAKTLCAMPADTKLAVIEMGMNHGGEIAQMAPHVAPDIAIVTNIYPMHLENFVDITGIAHAKSEIFDGLSRDGIAIINGDSDCIDILLAAARKRTNNIIIYGARDLVAVDGLNITANIAGRVVSFALSQPGEHQIANALCVLNTVAALGLDVNAAATELVNFGALPGRGKIYELPLAKGGWTLIDESYSAQPESLKIAIRNLDKMSGTGRKIAVVGKMAEIGDRSAEFHREIGRVLADTQIGTVVGICPETKDILSELRPDQTGHYFDNNENLESFLLNELLQDGDIVLVKGSHHGSKLHQTVAKLLK
jgi:UDP-N-acetylmuramoyl-tripeptide--D-alanyl-D-alanine ligase